MNLHFWARDKKKKSKESFDSELLNVDFFCQLNYMAAIATSGISRSGLFFYAAKLPYIATRFFRRVDFVAKMFNHDYSQACRIVGEKTKQADIKALLLRLSGALSSGEDIAGFLNREASVLSELYGNNYEKRLDLLKKWADAYVSLIMTSALVTVMSVVTMMIGNVTITFMATLTALTILTTIFGAWFLFHTAPRETKNHKLPYRSREQDLIRSLTKLILPLGLITLVFLIIIGASLGMLMVAAGIFLFPIGFIATIDDSKISKRDNDISAFLRSLGGVMQAIGATATEAMGRIDFRSLGMFKEDVKLLYTRLQAGITPNLAWNRFVCETGSELVNRTVTTFWDGINLGGEPQKVGNAASDFALKIAMLRSHRSQIASGFTWLTVAMHTVLVALSVFVYSVFVTFSGLVKSLMPQQGDSSVMSNMASFGLFSQGSTQLNLLHFMVILIIIILTLANAYAIYAVSGGHSSKLFLYLAIMSTISGAILIGVPIVVSMMFHMF
jgi:archaeal flagellar protein FlaJ